MKKYLLPKEGKFYKANLHMHTTISDGRMTLEETKREFMKHGYSIVAFTDHEIMVPHKELTDDNFLAITSTEIIVNLENHNDFGYIKTYHLKPLFFYELIKIIIQLLKQNKKPFGFYPIWLLKCLLCYSYCCQSTVSTRTSINNKC